MTDDHRADDHRADDHRDGPADEAVIDESIRQVVRSIATAAPEPPAFSSSLGRNVEGGAPPANGRPRRHSGLLLAAVVSVVAIGAGTLAAVNARRSGDGPTTEASGPVVRHQVLSITVDAELPCEGAIDAGHHTIRVESWLDEPGERFRQQVTDDRGAAADYVNEGPMPYPVRAYERGDRDQIVNPACPPPHEYLLSGDLPDNRSVFPMLNPDRALAGSRGYADAGAPVPGDHEDQLGRPATLYRLVDEGAVGQSESEMIAFHLETEWYVDPDTGDVLQLTERGESEGNRLERTMVVTSDETVPLDPTLFSTEGYTLLYDAEAPDPATDRFTAEAIGPTIELGQDGVIWPSAPEPGGASALGRRFGTEVLGWADPQVTEDGTGNVRVEDGDGHAVTLFVPGAGDQGGSVVGQLGGSASTTGFGPGARGDAQVGFHPLTGVTTIVIHTRTTDGEMLAWRAPTSAEKQYEVLLPDMYVGAVGPWLVVFYDAEGRAVDAFGWGSSF